MKIRKFKHINEDTPQNNTATPQQLGAAPATNNQQQGLQQQQNNNQAPLIDYNACASNINKFIGNLYKNIQDTVKNNLEKSCPEAAAIVKDANSPLKEQATALNNAMQAFTKAAVNPDDAKTISTSIEDFAKFITALTTFNTQVTLQASLQPELQPADNNTNAALANTQANNAAAPAQPNANNNAAPALPAGNNANAAPAANNQQQAQQQNASYDTSHFGKMLMEKLAMKQYKKAIKQVF